VRASSTLLRPAALVAKAVSKQLLLMQLHAHWQQVHAGGKLG
jgi:hypothetical protein